MSSELATKYNPDEIEEQVAQRWKDANAFGADPAGGGDPYCIVIPPPNVTAALHMGHALNNTLQDILIRWRRMLGDNTVWIPGTDHAGIATQTVVDKRLQAEGKPAIKDYKKLEADGQNGRAQFIEKVQAWKDEYERRITEQLKLMGCSCDWSRQRFTMDDTCARSVREAFFKLFKDGLIYRGKRLVNWDPATQTALADDEVEMRDIDGHFWYMKYPLAPAPGGEPVMVNGETITHITIATTRPETMLGDTAVAINPKDPRAQALVGKHVLLPIVNRQIPIIADDYVVLGDPDSDDPKAKFATGLLKVTPAHDPNDWEISLRHDLPVINVMALDASISKDHGWPEDDFARADSDAVPLGKSREDARKAIVDWFDQNGLLEEVRPYRHAVGHSYRSHVAIEPYLSDQWYIQTASRPDRPQPPEKDLAALALRALSNPERAVTFQRAATIGRAATVRERGSVSDEPRPSGSGAPCENQSATSRDRQGAGLFNHYLITFTTYGTWLHGDAKGSVDRNTNLPGTPPAPEHDDFVRYEKDQLKHEPITLDADQRRCVRDTVQEVCRHRGWRLDACNVRTNHVHIVVCAQDTPEKILNDFKSYATRRLIEGGLIDHDKTVWTRHGSTRYLKEDASVHAACRYVFEEQGGDPVAVATDNGQGQGGGKGNPLPDGRGSQRASSGGRSQLRFHPQRYAKTFQTWHENIRDWCISRQLWWGHRIPVWSKQLPAHSPYEAFKEMIRPQAKFINHQHVHCEAYGLITGCEIDFMDQEYDEPIQGFVCLQFDDPEVIAELESLGFERDPDVLDTWFSSALWPFSTLGWPDETPEVQKWNPGNVLCTAREIITLWVSRMVMTNLYFRGKLPFTDVFIHAMIQDGQGRKMSKSLGNGVDPLDIIKSHGSDAMRYTLAVMTTQTQDVRLPVAKDPETGHNTSDKFDNGRNFANKVWNATRFALTNLEAPLPEKSNLPDAEKSQGELGLGLADKWILSRLAATVRDTDAALERFDFNGYAQGLYNFFWRDLCDWYIEAIKPTVAGDAVQRRVMAVCLDASLRLLHPVMPFITEKLWERLNSVAPIREVSGVSLHPAALLIHAPWPKVADGLIDEQTESAFGLVQQVVGALRQVRTTHQVPPKQTVTFSAQASSAIAQQILDHQGLIETLANVQVGEVGPHIEKPDDAAATLAGGVALYLHGLVDAETERDRLTKKIDEVTKNIAALSGRLSNKKYVDKAPQHLVQQSRDQLASAQKEAGALQEQLAALQ